MLDLEFDKQITEYKLRQLESAWAELFCRLEALKYMPTSQEVETIDDLTTTLHELMKEHTLLTGQIRYFSEFAANYVEQQR